MRRGERALYRAIADAARPVAESKDYAQEYMAKRRLLDADNALGQWARERMDRAGAEPDRDDSDAVAHA